MNLIIQTDEGQRTVIPLVGDEITIGRNDGNLVCLSEKDVSRKHGRLVRDGDRYTVEDLGSFTGIRVNGERIHKKRVVAEGDLIEISRYDLMLQREPGEDELADRAPKGEPEVANPSPHDSAEHHQRRMIDTATIPLVPPHVPAAPPARQRRGRIVGFAAAALAIAAGGYAWTRHRPADADADAKAARRFALRAADEARSSHRYVEAMHDLDVARRAGAVDAELAGFETVAAEAHSEELYVEMEAAASSQDFERARRLLPLLVPSRTYYGAKAADSAARINAGYANLHVAAATRMKRTDRPGCLASAHLALAADPGNAQARSLIATCKASPPRATASRTAPPALRPTAAHRVLPDDGAPARQLVSEGNQKLTAHEVDAALALFGKALSLRPASAVLAGAYRGLGIAYTRKGDVEQGARYYRLYLPLCTDPIEQAQLQRALADYEARRR